jgi:hypothetical protein
LLFQRAHGVGSVVMYQVSTVAEALRAKAAGADVIVARFHFHPAGRRTDQCAARSETGKCDTVGSAAGSSSTEEVMSR